MGKSNKFKICCTPGLLEYRLISISDTHTFFILPQWLKIGLNIIFVIMFFYVFFYKNMKVLDEGREKGLSWWAFLFWYNLEHFKEEKD